MIDITPRNPNYSSAMGTNFERHDSSPSHHASSFAHDRELNDVEGKCQIEVQIFYSVKWFMQRFDAKFPKSFNRKQVECRKMN